MKYALNHAYEFDNWAVAYSAGFMKMFMCYNVELYCLLVICVSVAPMAIVYNFIALGIIADFDNYIFESYIDCFKTLLEDK
jgi:hypothetical protein